jgi:hypothetical protein
MRKTILILILCAGIVFNIQAQNYPYYSEIYGLYLDEYQIPIYHPLMDWSEFRYRAFRYYEFMGWDTPRYLHLGTPPHIYYGRLPYWKHNNWKHNKYVWRQYNARPKYYKHPHYKSQNKNENRKYYKSRVK